MKYFIYLLLTLSLICLKRGIALIIICMSQIENKTHKIELDRNIYFFDESEVLLLKKNYPDLESNLKLEDNHTLARSYIPYEIIYQLRFEMEITLKSFYLVDVTIISAAKKVI
jgi:hypothetical protein